MSSIPQDKDQLIAAITQASTKLLDDYQCIPDKMARIKGVDGNIKGAVISPADTLAYLIGWGRLVLKWHTRKAAGEPVDFPETGFKWNQLGLLAEHFHYQYREWSFAELKSEFQQVTQQILELIQSLDNDTLYQKQWYKNHTLGRMIQFNTSSPMKNIRTKVRRFNREQGIV